MRVLHLLDQRGPQATSATLALLAQAWGRLGAIGQHLLLFGNGAFHRRAQTMGMREAVRVRGAYGSAVLAWPALRREIRLFGPLGTDDVVHCWSVGTLTLASLMFRRMPRLLTLTVPPSPRAIHWLRMICQDSSAPLAILTISATIRRTVLGGGVPQDMVHVVRPALDMAMVPPRKLEARNVHVIALLGDPATGPDALAATRAVMNAADARGPRLRLMVHPDQTNRLRAQRLLRPLGREDWMICDAELAEPWRVLPYCDLALAIGPHAGHQSLLWAMAANVPIVGEATYAVSEIVEDRHSALLTKPGDHKAMGHRINQLLDDSQLAWKLKDTARHEAYSFFSRKHYCDSLRAVYAQITSARTIEVPPLPVTGGLRFTGRA